MKTQTPICEAKDIEKDFILPHGQTLHVLDKVSLVIYPNEVVAIIGPSGCGKSTLLRILAGLEPATKGSLFYKQKKHKGLLPDVSIVFQAFALYPWFSLEENVKIVLEAEGLSPLEIESKTKEALSLVGLVGFEEAYPREVSGGMKQRVGIARALARDPLLLFMDEPFSNLDAFTAETLRSEVLSIWSGKARRLSSILLISHDIQEVVYMADRIVVMKANPGHIHSVIENKLPRPRDYRSPEFIHLVEQLHATYATATTPEATTSLEKKPNTPLLSVTHDKIIGILHYLKKREGTEDLYKMGAKSNLTFDEVVLALQAAELLNFIEILHRTVSLTEIGKKYLSSSPSIRTSIWKEQLLTIPVFTKVYNWLITTPAKSLTQSELILFLTEELPHQDAHVQLKVLLHWGVHGKLFTYHKKSKSITV